MIAASWNLIICLVISLVCWSFLLSSRSEGRLSILLNAGLLLLAVGIFVSAFEPLARGTTPGWWTLMARTGAAIGAAILYETRFGMRAQAIALYVHFASFPARWRAAYLRLRHAYHQVARR